MNDFINYFSRFSPIEVNNMVIYPKDMYTCFNDLFRSVSYESLSNANESNTDDIYQLIRYALKSCTFMHGRLAEAYEEYLKADYVAAWCKWLEHHRFMVYNRPLLQGAPACKNDYASNYIRYMDHDVQRRIMSMLLFYTDSSPYNPECFPADRDFDKWCEVNCRNWNIHTTPSYRLGEDPMLVLAHNRIIVYTGKEFKLYAGVGGVPIADSSLCGTAYLYDDFTQEARLVSLYLSVMYLVQYSDVPITDRMLETIDNFVLTLYTRITGGVLKPNTRASNIFDSCCEPTVPGDHYFGGGYVAADTFNSWVCIYNDAYSVILTYAIGERLACCKIDLSIIDKRLKEALLFGVRGKSWFVGVLALFGILYTRKGVVSKRTSKLPNQPGYIYSLDSLDELESLR